jgi:hypothetical protein
LNPIENVLTFAPESRAINPTTTLESTPPDRNAPSGTSLIIRNRTASVIFSRKTSQASSSPIRSLGS